MADWLGQLMSDWPSWAVFLMIAIIVVSSILYYFAYYGGESGNVPSWRRKKQHGKK